MPENKPDFYEILGVKRDATQAEIKKAYRRLARKHHPDVNPGDDAAEERFKEISQANATLSDKEKRAKYDQFGDAWQQAQNSEQWQDGNFEQFVRTRFGAGDFADIFGDLFGGGMQFAGGGGRSRVRPDPGPMRGQDVSYDLPVSFEDAVHGVEKQVTLTLSDRCPECDGMGGKAESCPMCGGTGQAQAGGGGFFAVSPCPQCQGTGQVITSRCRKCRGTGEVTRTRKLKVHIPAGVRTGSKVRVAGEGGQGTAGGPNGDLMLNIQVQPHKHFRREGDDIHLDLPLTFVEAAAGARVSVPTIDGPVTMTIPAGTSGGSTLRLKGRGVKKLGAEGHGDQHVHVKVTVPENLSGRQVELLDEFGETWRENPREALED